MCAVHLAKRLERRAQFGGEQVWLLPGGEVAAPVSLVEVDEVRIDLLGPAARGPEDLVGERGEGDRERDLRGRLPGRTSLGPSSLPVRTRGRGPSAGQPVQRDVVENVVAGEVARGLAAGKPVGDLVVAVGVVVEHPGRERYR